MSDPGLPPRPPSLNLLASLVKEEESKENLPLEQQQQGSLSKSQEFYDADKQQITREVSASSFKEFKMKSEDMPKTNPNSGFRGKKMMKQRSSSVDDPVKVRRPFSADYNQQKNSRLNGIKQKKRPKTSKGTRGQKGRASPAQGQRPRSPHAYSSDTSYSSDSEYIIKASKTENKFHPDNLSAKKAETDSFFDSDNESKKDKHDQVEKRKSDTNSFFDLNRETSTKTNGLEETVSHDIRVEYQNGSRPSTSGYNRNTEQEYTKAKGREYKHSTSTSDTYTSDEEEWKNDSKESSENIKGYYSQNYSQNRKQRNSKTVYVNQNGEHRDSGNSNERMVVVEDCSSSFSSSSDEEEPPKVKRDLPQKPKSAPLLKRKKQKSLKVLQVSPDQYLETKLHQKYCELEELMNCSFVDQKSHVTRYHLYQMELLNNQYKSVSHGLQSSGVIIPRSLPGDVRQRSSRLPSAKRPSSAKMYYHREGELDTNESAYSTLRSVMAAEHARKTNKIRTDINAERPPSGKKITKKKIKIEAKLKTEMIDEEEEDVSDKPSVGSRGSSKDSSRSLSQHDTPHGGTSIDHHIKYTDNEKLKKWLKEKDKLYRKQVKEERKKKKDEREKLISEANQKLERRIKSQKAVKKWMHAKDKELRKKHKEEDERMNEELKRIKKMEINLPGDTMKIRPQSAPSTGRSDDINIDKGNLKGGDTPEYVRDQIHQKREIEEENKQAKKAEKTDPHPPQTKFIYKRPVAGKIKLKMEVRGKSPVAKEPVDDKEDSEDKAKEMRLSYDDWLKKKRNDDALKKSMKEAQKKRELAKSDPELDRMIPDIAKKRIEEKLSSRKRVNTGIKKFDDEANKSFGGSEFGGEIEDRPRNSYRLEGDNRGSKQSKRPSTAPASRSRVPHPTKSASSPRKAVIPQKVDKVMANNDQSNPYTVPFPPEKGVPPHVAARQRKIFADRVTENLNEIEQRALLNSELIKEGLSEYTEGYTMQQQTDTENSEQEHQVPDKRPGITELMYSPRQREESSESSDDGTKPVEGDEKVANVLDNEDQITVVGSSKVNDQNEDQTNSEKRETADTSEVSENNANTAYDIHNTLSEKEIRQTETESQEKQTIIPENDTAESTAETVEKNMYRSFNNLNELTVIDKKSEEFENKDTNSEKPKNVTDNNSAQESNEEAFYDHPTESNNRVENTDPSSVEVVNDTDNNSSLISILKESKRSENIPVPEVSGEPTKPEQINEEQDEFLLPRDESEGLNRKRVSFNEKTEVFQSFESTSSSTDTLTPEPSEFDANWESLEAYPDEPDPTSETDEKVSFNIAGFELNPVIINGNEERTNNEDVGEENKTFITDSTA